MTLPKEPKGVRYFPDERLELKDHEDDQWSHTQRLKANLRALVGEGNAPTKGWVFDGFTLSYSTSSLTITVDAVQSVAMDHQGRLLLRLPADGSQSITLTAGSTSRIYAYVYDVETDSDARRRFARSLGAEVGVNDFTRTEPVVGFFEDTTGSNPTYSLAPNGQTVALVPLWEVTTDLVGVPGSPTDLRNHFGSFDDTVLTPATGGHGVTGIWSGLSALASRLWRTWDANSTVTSGWWDTGSIRDNYTIDLELQLARVSSRTGGNIYSNLKSAIDNFRFEGVVVGNGYDNYGDFTGVAGLKNALEYPGVSAINNAIFVKSGIYSGVGQVTLPQNGMHIQGVRGGYQSLGGATVWKPITTGSGISFSLESRKHITVEGIVFDTTLNANNWRILIKDAESIVFRGCEFVHGANHTGSLISVQDSTDVRFEGCSFVSSNLTYPQVSVTGASANQNVRFEGCSISTSGRWLSVQNDARDVWVDGCEFRLASSGSSISYLIDASINQAISGLHVRGCYFNDLSSGDYTTLLNLYQTSGGLFDRVGFDVEDCRCQNLSTTFLTIGGVGIRSRVKDCDLFSAYDIPMIKVASSAGIQEAGAVDIEDCDFRFYSLLAASIGIMQLGGTGTSGTSTLRVRGNRFQNAGKGIHLTSPSNLSRPLIENNEFISCNRAMDAFFTQLDRLTFRGNVIQDCGNVGDISVYSHTFASAVSFLGGQLLDCEIRDNHFKQVGATITTSALAPLFIFGQFDGVRVEGNRFTGCGNVSIASVTDQIATGQIVALSEGTKGTGLHINRNRFHQESFGAFIHVDLGNDGSDEPIGVEVLEIDGNYGKDTGGGLKRCAVKVGMVISGPATPILSDADVDVLSCCANKFETLMRYDSSYAAAPLEFAMDNTGRDFAFGYQRVQVSNNSVSSSLVVPPFYGVNLGNGTGGGTPVLAISLGKVSDNVLYGVASIPVSHPGLTPAYAAYWSVTDNISR